MMKLPSLRATNILAFLICCALLSFAAYLQFVKGIEPCPLCIIQRVSFIIIALLFLGAIFIGSRSWRSSLYYVLMILVALTGLIVAGRQVWLQHLPLDQVPACGPGLSYMLDHLNLDQTLNLLFQGSGQCAEVHWTFLSLSIAEWSFICFAVLLCLIVVNYFRLRR